MSNPVPAIITLPNKGLRTSSKKVTHFDKQVRELIKDMENATLTWEAGRDHEVGVALAAVQIDRHSRVIIVRDSFEDKGSTTFTAYINPQVTKTAGKPVVDYEGCLSVQDIYGLVPRFPEIEITAQDIDGNTIKEKIEGFRARVVQHEIDHLNGKLFIDHIKKFDVFFELDPEGDLAKLAHETVIASDILW